MEPRTIKGSRWKSALLLLVSVAFVLFGGTTLVHPDQVENSWWLWLCTGFFGLCAVVFFWRVVRPDSLRLDAEGFTFDDLLGRPHRTLWGDVESFFLFRLPRGGDMVAFNYAPGRAPKSSLLKMSQALGADGGIPGMWSLSKKDLVSLLNDYRSKAVME